MSHLLDLAGKPIAGAWYRGESKIDFTYSRPWGLTQRVAGWFGYEWHPVNSGGHNERSEIK